MEFGEKLQELRSSKNLTQEELAEALFVSRTAISKWESGRGYPNIDSLKEISKFFGVSIDELLSAERILSIAEKETKKKINSILDMIFGIADLLALMLIFLPIYPNRVDGFYYAVNLLNYTQTSSLNLQLFWAISSLLIIIGIIKIIITQLRIDKAGKVLVVISMLINIIAVLITVMAREPYAASILFIMIVLKGALIYNKRE